MNRRHHPVIALAALFMVAAPAAADTFFVSITDDEVDADLLDGLCLTATGPRHCSLRAAIQQANFTPGLDTIIVEAGLYELTGTGAFEDGAQTGDLDITDDLVIEGLGAGLTIIDGWLSDRVFHVHAGATVTIRDLTVQGGRLFASNDVGGGICNSGTLTLIDVEVADCGADGPDNLFGRGGGIFSNGTLEMTDCVVRDNHLGDSSLEGGGLMVEGPLTMTDCVVSHNMLAQGKGGGLSIKGTSVLTRVNIVGNVTEDGPGGGLHSGAGTGVTIAMHECRIEDNVANDDGGVLFSGNGGGVFSRSMSFHDCTFSGNTAELYGGAVIISATYDVFYGCTFSDNHSQHAGAVGTQNFGRGRFNNCTFSANTATLHGGALQPGAGRFDCLSCTLIGNVADADHNGSGDGGAIYGVNSTNVVTTITNCLVAGNLDFGGEAPDIHSPWSGFPNRLVESGGYNLIGDDTGLEQFFGETAGNQFNVDPLAGPLADNGGPTLTHAFAYVSPAKNAANPAGCVDHDGAPLPTDQRGEPRSMGGRSDIGAFELFPDCNDDGIIDDDQLVDNDCDANGVPDECDADCNGNGIPDACDIADGTSDDCNGNGVPDECDEDCNGDGIPNDCDPDCDDNGVPDGCDIAGGAPDCDGDGRLDSCQFDDESALDCNGNGVLDGCEIADGVADDCNDDGLIDDCQAGATWAIGVGAYYSYAFTLDGAGEWIEMQSYYVQGILDGFTGLARHPATGVYYALGTGDFGGTEWERHLLTIDPFTGAWTDLGDPGPFLADLAFHADGTLYATEGNASGGGGTLWTVSTTDASLTATGIVAARGGGQSIAFRPGTDDLFHRAGQTLEVIDVSSGVITTIAETSPVDSISCMGFTSDGATLYGFDGSNLYAIDPDDGATTELPFSGGSNYGLVVLSDPDDACAGIPGDIDGSGDVSFDDLLAILANWGPCIDCPADVNGDGIVDFADLLVVLANWT